MITEEFQIGEQVSQYPINTQVVEPEDEDVKMIPKSQKSQKSPSKQKSQKQTQQSQKSNRGMSAGKQSKSKGKNNILSQNVPMEDEESEEEEEKQVVVTTPRGKQSKAKQSITK